MLTTILTGLPAEMGPEGGGLGWDGPGGGGLLWLLVLIPVLGFLLLVALFAVIGRRWRRGQSVPGLGRPGMGAPGLGAGQPGWPDGQDSGAERTLAERFAQGDIDEADYRARLEVLRASRPAAATPPSQ